nr:DUF4406 domain-containing protein [Trinickia dinghuensis]
MPDIAKVDASLFDGEAARLREFGFTVINPAEIDPDGTKSWRDRMRAHIEQIVTCDAVALLPGWERCRAAPLMHHIAATLNLWIFTVDELVDMQRKTAACS